MNRTSFVAVVAALLLANVASTLIAAEDSIVVEGKGFRIERFDNATRAFSNRGYVWHGVPTKFRGWEFTQLAGGGHAQLQVSATTAGFVYAATDTNRVDLAGWEIERSSTFNYSAKGGHRMFVYRIALPAGTTTHIKQFGWPGTIIMAPRLKSSLAEDKAQPKREEREPQRVGGIADQQMQKDARKLGRNQASIKGLFVVRTSAGLRVGGAQDIIATAERVSSNRETICDFATDVANDTKISMEEARRLLKVRYPVWQAGYRIGFSYSNKYSKQGGGSAGGAFAVLLLSLLDGMQIDPDFGMTGDVTVDGKIREVGAVPEKLRGALLDKCKVVAIPETNKENLNDLVLLYSPSMLWSMQILSVTTLDDAAAIARVDRPEKLAKAMELFAQVQRSLGASATAYALRNAGIIQTLQQVLQLAPNHLSAEFMLRANAGRIPNTLSLGGSLEEIWAAAGPLLAFLFADYKQPDKSKRYYFEKVPAAAFKAAMERLNWLQFRLHPKTRELKAALADYMTSLDQLHRASSFSSGALKQHLARRDKVLSEAHLLGTDRKTLEEMMH